MSNLFIERKFWCENNNGESRKELSLSDIDQYTGPQVILAEAGMGKSYLLEMLSKQSKSYAHCTATKLINRTNPTSIMNGAETLLIDALDEAYATQRGGALNEVLQKLGQLDYPRFILSCRVAEWHSARSEKAIGEQYENGNLQVVHLVPFSSEDQMTFLSATLGEQKAKAIIEHYQLFGLDGILGNPQILEFVKVSAQETDLPKTRAELFEKAVHILRKEGNDTKALDQLGEEKALDSAGAAFASLILTGKDAIARVAAANQKKGDLLPVDLPSPIPGFEFPDAILHSCLFSANGTERFSYCHRLIGEYLGACWLIKYSKTPGQRDRLLAVFDCHRSVVPASLRGIHAWLAQDAELMPHIIAKDPMGLIEYGHADQLTLKQAELLLTELENLARSTPDFSNQWRFPYAMEGILHAELIDRITRLIADREAPCLLRCLLIQASRNSPFLPQMQDVLCQVFFDVNDIFIVRRAAGEVILQLSGQDWEKIIEDLTQHKDENSLRLAMSFIDGLDYLNISNELIATVAVDYEKTKSSMSGKFLALTLRFPLGRINELIEKITEKIQDAENEDRLFYEGGKLRDCLYGLLDRKIKDGAEFNPSQLLRWLPVLKPLGVMQDRESFDDYIQNNDVLRQSVQRLAVLNFYAESRESRGELLPYQYGLLDSFKPDNEDVMALLNTLTPEQCTIKHLQGIVQLVEHDWISGIEVRCVARKLIDDLVKMVRRFGGNWRSFKKKERQKESAQQEKNEKERISTRDSDQSTLEAIRKAKLNSPLEWVKKYIEKPSVSEDILPPHESLIAWLGEELSLVVFGDRVKGKGDPLPTATDIVNGVIEGKGYRNVWIIVAALTERIRKSIPLDDLSDELLMVAIFHLWFCAADTSAESKSVETRIEKELKEREVWKRTVRRYIEPQITANCQTINNLGHFMDKDRDNTVAFTLALALEWLERFPEASIGAQKRLLRHLICTKNIEPLYQIMKQRVADPCQNNNLKRFWQAVGLILDFEETKQLLSTINIEPELIWELMYLQGLQSNDKPCVQLNNDQIEWIITTFRPHWPYANPPLGWSGDRNGWDATEYICNLVRSLGSQISDDTNAALRRLKDAEQDGYTNLLKQIYGEQEKELVESKYTPCSLDRIKAIIQNTPPTTSADLQAYMLWALSDVQKKIKSDSVDSWKYFYDGWGTQQNPRKEEDCRNGLIGLLPHVAYGVTLSPEAHLGSNKKADIACSIGQGIMLPIEIKGQWHRDLWHAADTQLDRWYTKDYKADRLGIYLVLWFGNNIKEENKKLKAPPGKGIKKPDTPEQLKRMLEERSESAQEGRVKIFVLDLERSF